MDDRRVGLALRALRIRRGWRQKDLGSRARVPLRAISLIERGRVADVRVSTVRTVAETLGTHLELLVRSASADVERLLNARHAAMQEALIREFRSVGGWQPFPEVSFSYYGERGVIDVLAWHAGTRSLLVIELKTALVDIGDLLGTMDRRSRLAWRIATDRGWEPTGVSGWVAMADSRTNRRHVAAHATTLRAKFPTDGRGVAGWLRRPMGELNALSFLPKRTDTARSDGFAVRTRVRAGSKSTPCTRTKRGRAARAAKSAPGGGTNPTYGATGGTYGRKEETR
jgi:transcriptional regulator with XRE-family HTH domain